MATTSATTAFELTIPPDLVQQVARGNCVVFVGAGLSAGAGLPGWWTLLKRLLEHLKSLPDHDPITTKIIEKQLNNDQLLDVARDLRQELGRDVFNQQLQQILTPKTGPLETHRLISKLNLHAVLTTNYDTLLEATYNNEKTTFTQVDVRQLSEAFRMDDLYILKCHGDIEKPETIILTKDDYDTVIHEAAAFQKHIEYLFMAKTILYLGYSLKDPDFDLFRGRLKSIFGEHVPKQYALMGFQLDGASEAEANDLRSEMAYRIRKQRENENLHIIPYKLDATHSDVPKMLRLLVEKSGAVDISDTRPKWDINTQGSPFPGLRPFEEKDSAVFFGREREIVSLHHKLQMQQFMIVIGASGSGKSSLVWAGLIPYLRREIPQVHFVRITPGRDPFENLFASDALQAIEGVNIKTLKLERKAILPILDGVISPRTDTQIVLFIDQFEELFTLTENEADRADFADMLKLTTPRVHVVATMRADFYHLATKYFERELTEANLTLSQPMSYQLHDMIEGPAKVAGITFDEGLVDRIVRDTGDEPGNLPLLAYLLDQLYKQDDDQNLTMEEYNQLGGVQGAIGMRASEVYTGLSDDEEAKFGWLQRVFRELVTVDDRGVPTRNRATLESIAEADRPWLEEFEKTRLLIRGREEGTSGKIVVQVAHEALLREWETLSQWVEKQSDFFRIVNRFKRGAAWWQSKGKRHADLPNPTQIKEFRAACAALGFDPAKQVMTEYLAGAAGKILEELENEPLTRAKFNRSLKLLHKRYDISRTDVYMALYKNAQAELETDSYGNAQLFVHRRMYPALLAYLEHAKDTEHYQQACGGINSVTDVALLDGVQRVLANPDHVYRTYPASILTSVWFMGHPDIIPHIRTLLEAFPDDMPTVVRCMQILADLALPSTLDMALGKINHEDDAISFYALVACGEIGDERAIQPLVDMARNMNVIQERRTTACFALTAIGTDRAKDALLNLLRDKNEMVRGGVVIVQQSTPNPTFSDTLLSMLDSRSSLERATATHALATLGEMRLQKRLKGLLKDNDDTVCQQAIYACELLQVSDYVSQLIKLLRHDNPNIRYQSAQALGVLGDSNAVMPLVDLLHAGSEVEGNESVREAIIDALERLQDNRAMGALLSSAIYYGEIDGFYAVPALKHLDREPIRNALFPLARDGNLRAIHVLGLLGEPHPETIILLESLTVPQGDEVWSISEVWQQIVAAIAALGYIADVACYDALFNIHNTFINADIEDIAIHNAIAEALLVAFGTVGDARIVPHLLEYAYYYGGEETGLQLIETLGMLKSNEAVSYLAGHIYQEGVREGELGYVVDALATIGDPTVNDDLRDLLEHDSLRVTNSAAIAIGSIGMPQMVYETLQHDRMRTRGWVVSKLTAPAAPGIVQMLLDHYPTDVPRVQAYILVALMRLNEDKGLAFVRGCTDFSALRFLELLLNPPPAREYLFDHPEATKDEMVQTLTLVEAPQAKRILERYHNRNVYDDPYKY